MRREIFTEEHEQFRAQFCRFAEREIEPKIAQWNRERITDRATWRRMGEAGFLGPAMPTEYGGGGGDTPSVRHGRGAWGGPACGGGGGVERLGWF